MGIWFAKLFDFTPLAFSSLFSTHKRRQSKPLSQLFGVFVYFFIMCQCLIIWFFSFPYPCALAAISPSQIVHIYECWYISSEPKVAGTSTCIFFYIKLFQFTHFCTESHFILFFSHFLLLFKKVVSISPHHSPYPSHLHRFFNFTFQVTIYCILVEALTLDFIRPPQQRHWKQQLLCVCT